MEVLSVPIDVSPMAVCKRCGCAMPIGSKTCDVCSVYGAGTPVQPQAWVPPANAAVPAQLASSAASWAGGHAARPSQPLQLDKARKQVRRAARYFVVVGGISVGLGTLAELFDWTAVQGLFNWFAVGEGAIFLAIAYFVRGGSMTAIVIGAALYCLDTLALLFAGYFSIVRLLIIAVLIRAVLAANLLRLQRKAASTPDQSRAA